MDKIVIDCQAGTAEPRPLDDAESAQQQADQQAAADAAWTTLRADRDARLAACDWTQLPDTGLSAEDIDAWATYRQALRDLPEHTTDPANPDWPQPPATEAA